MAAPRTRKFELEIGSEAKGVGKGFDKADKELSAFEKKMSAAGDKAGKGFRTGVEGETDKLNSKLKAFGSKASDTLGSGFSSAGGAASDALSSGFDIGGIADSLGGMLGSLPGQLGPVAGAAGVAIGGAIAIGLEESMDREMSSDRLAARLGATAEESERLGRIAGDLYAGAYGESIDDVNLALESLTFAIGDVGSVTDEELTRAGEMALDFANIWGVDVTEAVGDVGILVSTGLARDWEEAFDLMFVAMDKIPPAFRDDLLPAIEEYAGFAAGLGITGSEAFAIMARSAEDFGRFGIDKSVDALKEFSDRATDMSTGTVEAFDTIGLDAGTMADRILAGGDIARGAFDETVEGLLSIEDPATRAVAAAGLFGEPLKDLSVQKIPEFLENLANLEGGLGDVSGAMEAAGDTANDNLGTRWEEMKRGVLDKLVTFIDTKLIPGLGRLGDVFDTKIRPALELVMPLFRGFFGFMGEHPLIFQVAAGIGGITLAAMLLLNPLTLAIGLIGGLILAVKFLWEKLQEGWEWVRTHWPGLADILENPVATAAGFITEKFGDIKIAATSVKNWITGKFDELVGSVAGLPGRIRSAAAGMFGGIADDFRSTLNRIIRWWNNLRFPRFDIPSADPLGPFGPSIGGGHIGGWNLPNIDPLAEGGIVRARPGGILANIGEGRHDEAVIPLDGSHDMGGDSGDVNVYFDFRGAKIHDRAAFERDVIKALDSAGTKGVPITIAGRRL